MTKILVVDDSWLLRQATTRIVKKEKDYEVLEAVGGEDGLQKIAEIKPDCILLDLLMPDIDGFEVIKKMNEDDIRIPVIILSADIQETTKKKCFDMGIKMFLNKPPKEDEVLKAIKEAIC